MKPKTARWIIILLVCCSVLSSAEEDITLVLCRPEVNQIRNIVELFERDILPLERLELICLHHEEEVTDYRPARTYVEQNRLGWISFRTLSQRVALNRLFTHNTWRASFAEIVDSSDGVIFTGGMDIPPRLYGEPTHLMSECTTPVRSEYESSFLFHLLGGPQDEKVTPLLETRPRYAILAICLGAQTMNIATGGTLVQDIPMEIYGLSTVEDLLRLPSDMIHSSRYLKTLYHGGDRLAPAFHRIRILPDSILAVLLNGIPDSSPLVLSSHHQAVEKLGRSLRVTAVSTDGKIVETIEHTRFPAVLGVQFHPEYRGLYSKNRSFKTAPDSEGLTSLRSLLMAHHPSMDFHHALWSWFARALVDSRRHRKGSP